MRRLRPHGFLLVLSLLIVVPSLWNRDLWNPDEPRYAEVAREMVLSGDYLVPHLNGEIYAEKPPLFFWLSALLQGAGAGVAAGRLVTGVAAAGTLWIVFALARLWFSTGAALWAALILGSCELFARLGRFGVLDVPLTFLTTLAVYGWFRHRQLGGRAIVWFHVAMGLAVLTKGPVGLVPPLLAIVAGRTIPGRPRSRSHWLWGVPLTLGIIASWVVPACLAGGPEYAHRILWKQHMGRVVEDWGHPRPIWYYLPYLAVTFLPWVILLPRAVAWSWRRPTPRAIAVWFLLGFVFFSLVRGKRERYLLPLFPALAMVVGAYVDAMLAGRRTPLRRPLLFTHGIFFAIGAGFVALGALAPVLARRHHELRVFADDLSRSLLAAAGVALAALAFTLFRSTRRGRLRHGARGVVIAMVVALSAFDLVVVPRVNEVKSPRLVADAAVAQAAEALALYPHEFSGAYNLYTGTPRLAVLRTPAAVEAFLAAPGRRVVLTDRAGRETLAGFPGARVLELRRVGHRFMVLLTNYQVAGR